MKKRIVYTSAPTLGPFLTLILLGGKRKAKAAGSTSEVADASNSAAAWEETLELAAYEDSIGDGPARTESRLVPAKRVVLGPFLTLILMSRCQRPTGERAWTRCSLRSTLSRREMRTTSSMAPSASEMTAPERRASARDARR